MALALILVVGVLGGASDVSNTWPLDMPQVQELAIGDRTLLRQLRNAEALNGTPDSILCGRFDVPLRAAGGIEAEIPVAHIQEGSTARPTELAVRHLPLVELGFGQALPQVQGGEAAPEGGLDGLWYISIYCCRGDPGGAYCGTTAAQVQVAEGMVACSRHFPFGTRFKIRGDTLHGQGVVCRDRGSAVTARNHLDVFFEDCGIQEDPAEGTGWWWLQRTGTRVMVEVLE